MIDDTEVEGVAEAEPIEKAEPEAPLIPPYKPYAVLTDDGRVTQVAMTNGPMEGWVEITNAEYGSAFAQPNRWRMVDGKLVDVGLPPVAPAPTVIPKLELYRRMTDAEYDLMQQGVASQSARIQDVFRMVENFREGDSLWPLLVQMGHQLYGPDRTAELLAPFSG